MKTAWLIGRKVGHFVAVLFLSSLVLASLLWLSPGSPGKPRESVIWSKISVGELICLDRLRCGKLKGMPVAPPAEAEWRTDAGESRRNLASEFKVPAGTAVDFGQIRLNTQPVCVGGECGVLLSLPESGPSMYEATLEGAVELAPADAALLPGPGFVEWFGGEFWGGIARWDLGPAYNDEPILDMVMFGAKQTLPIVFGALVLALTLGLLLVFFLTWLPFPSMRGVLRTLLVGFATAPVFILGFFLTSFGVLPHPVLWWIAPLACVVILSLGDSNLGELLLQMENEVRLLKSRDYIHAAGLRGASAFKHMLPGLILPISSIGSAKVAFLLGSVVIAENIYAVQGLGTMSLNAAVKPDPMLLLTLTVFITFVVAAVALVRDLLEIAIDPRMRRAQEDSG